MTPDAPIPISDQVLDDSILHRIAAAYFSVGKQLERKTRCSSTRGFILSTLRDSVSLNQNQIAKILGFDRTVVHRTIKTLVREGLVAEKKAPTGRAIRLSLTPKGTKYRQQLIQVRKAADEKIREALSAEDRSSLLRLLKQVGNLEL